MGVPGFVMVATVIMITWDLCMGGRGDGRTAEAMAEAAAGSIEGPLAPPDPLGLGLGLGLGWLGHRLGGPLRLACRGPALLPFALTPDVLWKVIGTFWFRAFESGLALGGAATTTGGLGCGSRFSGTRLIAIRPPDTAGPPCGR